MDTREALPIGYKLSFPNMCCVLEGEIGRGSNGIVYTGWYFDQLNAANQHQVLVKELFPLHPRGSIYRDGEGYICYDEDGTETFELHRRSFERGNAAHLSLLKNAPDLVGANLNTFSYHNSFYTFLGFSGGQSLETLLMHGSFSLHRITQLMLSILDALEVFHASDFLHLDISPDNILVIGQDQHERAILIDFNSVHTLQELRNGETMDFSAKEGYSAPEVRMLCLKDIGQPADLFSVTALFYRCLFEEPPSFVSLTRPTPPDARGSVYLQDAPQTVCHMVSRILRHGLAVPPEQRYTNIAEMRLDFRELLERIEGVGITHWALWEASKRNIRRMVRENPSLAYLYDEEKRYPLCGHLQDSESESIWQCITALATKRNSALLIAEGGMGKTSSMLEMVASQENKYSANRTIPFYISLYGWVSNHPSQIQNRILSDLRFTAHTTNFAEARHTLEELLNTPIVTKKGTQPQLLLLLDGLNEVNGNSTLLIQEIKQLAKLEGVCLIVATRGDAPTLAMPVLTISPLRKEHIQAALSRNGLLLPETEEMQTLLQTPLILSLYIRTALAERKQTQCQTTQELLNLYFASLLEKEISGLPEGTPEKWRIDVALRYVLPCVARQIHRKGHALNDPELLPIVRRCYHVFQTKEIYLLAGILSVVFSLHKEQIISVLNIKKP